MPLDAQAMVANSPEARRIADLEAQNRQLADAVMEAREGLALIACPDHSDPSRTWRDRCEAQSAVAAATLARMEGA